MTGRGSGVSAVTSAGISDKTKVVEVPDFSPVARAYSRYRPSYPAELFAWLASLVERHDLAWDTATGSGQAAIGLAEHFDRVIATDLSAEQIRHAAAHPRIGYRVAGAEASGIAPHSADLVVAAAALHWFHLPKFYAEAARVLRPGGVIAAWTYHVAHVEPPFDEVLWPFCRDVVRPYFADGARLVEERYEGIGLPGTPIDCPPFAASANWNAGEIADFVGTWSGVQAYIAAHGEDPVKKLRPDIDRICGSKSAVHTLRWPLYLKASRM